MKMPNWLSRIPSTLREVLVGALIALALPFLIPLVPLWVIGHLVLDGVKLIKGD